MKQANVFGRKLASLRRAAHLSQELLAEKSGLSRNYIGLLECGHREPSLDTVLKIQRALGVKLETLAGGTAATTHGPKEASAPYRRRDAPSSEAYDRLMRRLRKCAPEEINTISKIVSQVVRLRHPRN